MRLHHWLIPHASAELQSAYARSRWVWSQVRPLLAAQINVPAQQLQVRRSSNGKPQIAGFPGAFSLAHDDHLALLAISDGSQLGVDVIGPARFSGPQRLAQRVFAAHELKSWEAADASARELALRQRFCVIEAVVKALDWRLWPALGGIEVLGAGTVARIPDRRARLHLAGGSLGNHRYALAADQAIAAVEIHAPRPITPGAGADVPAAPHRPDLH